jgi:hypothetical protein
MTMAAELVAEKPQIDLKGRRLFSIQAEAMPQKGFSEWFQSPVCSAALRQSIISIHRS